MRIYTKKAFVHHGLWFGFGLVWFVQEKLESTESTGAMQTSSSVSYSSSDSSLENEEREKAPRQENEMMKKKTNGEKKFQKTNDEKENNSKKKEGGKRKKRTSKVSLKSSSKVSLKSSSKSVLEGEPSDIEEDQVTKRSISKLRVVDLSSDSSDSSREMAHGKRSANVIVSTDDESNESLKKRKRKPLSSKRLTRSAGTEPEILELPSSDNDSDTQSIVTHPKKKSKIALSDSEEEVALVKQKPKKISTRRLTRSAGTEPEILELPSSDTDNDTDSDIPCKPKKKSKKSKRALSDSEEEVVIKQKPKKISTTRRMTRSAGTEPEILELPSSESEQDSDTQSIVAHTKKKSKKSKRKSKKRQEEEDEDDEDLVENFSEYDAEEFTTNLRAQKTLFCCYCGTDKVYDDFSVKQQKIAEDEERFCLLHTYSGGWVKGDTYGYLVDAKVDAQKKLLLSLEKKYNLNEPGYGESDYESDGFLVRSSDEEDLQ